jgi:hypothetical protein
LLFIRCKNNGKRTNGQEKIKIRINQDLTCFNLLGINYLQT